MCIICGLLFFWDSPQSNIDKFMKYLMKDRPSYNWGQSNVESVSEFLYVVINTLDYGGFQFYQTGLIHKVLEATRIHDCNEFPKTTNFESRLGTDDNGPDTKRYCPNSY